MLETNNLQESLLITSYKRGYVLWSQKRFWKTTVKQSAVMTDTREGKVWVGAKVVWVLGEAGNTFWVVKQRMGLYCCSGV